MFSSFKVKMGETNTSGNICRHFSYRIRNFMDRSLRLFFEQSVGNYNGQTVGRDIQTGLCSSV